MNRRAVLIAAIAALAGGCQNLGHSPMDQSVPNMADTATIASGMGVIAMQINLIERDPDVRPAMSLIFRKAGTAGLTHGILQLPTADNLVVIALPAGKYYFAELFLGPISGKSKDEYVFEVKPGRVTYVGDVDLSIFWTMRRWAIAIKDRQSAMQTRFETRYPLLLTAGPIGREIISSPHAP